MHARLRRLGAALVLLVALVAPVAAGAAPQTTVPPPEPVLRSLAALGADPSVLAAADESDLRREHRYLQVVDDLDGDGLPDLLAVAASPQLNAEREVALTARRGVDGAVLWSTRLDLPGLWAVVPTKAGEDGTNGLLLVSYTWVTGGGLWQPRSGEDPSGFGTTGAAVRLTVTAIDSGGSVVWSRDFGPGYFAYASGGSVRFAEELAVVAGTLQATGSAATDLLVGVYNRPASGDQTVVTMVLDGADGSLASEAELDIEGAYTELVVLEDLTGDGLDDYGVLMFPDDAETAELRTFAGVDGSALWSATVPDHPRLLAEPAGDVTGDGRSDVLVAPYHYTHAQSSQPHPAAVLAGADGTPVLSVPGDEAWALGDVSGDGRADVLVATVIRGEDVVGADLAAYRADGSTIYEARHAVPRDPDTTRVHFGVAGDVDGDGVPDPMIAPSGTGSVGPVTHVVSGRTGQLLRAGPLEGAPARASIGGSGDDLLTTAGWGRSMRDVTAFDGLSGDVLWSTRLRGGEGSSHDNWSAADLTGDGYAEVVVNVPWTTVEYDMALLAFFPASSVHGFVLAGADGSLLWSTETIEPPDPPEITGTATMDEPFTWAGSETFGATAVNGIGLGTFRECGPDEPVVRCEHVLVELVNTPAPGEADRSATGVVELDFDELVADFDLYVYESDAHGTKGPRVALSGNWFDTPGERATFPVVTTPESPSRFFLVEVAYFTNPTMAGYTGTAELVS